MVEPHLWALEQDQFVCFPVYIYFHHICLFSLASLAFIVRVLVLVTLKFVVSNFTKGLKETGEYLLSLQPIMCN